VDEYENPTALAEATRRVCEDEELRRQLRENAPDSVTRFECAVVDAQEVMYYQRILAETRQCTQKPSLFSKLLKKESQPALQDSSEFAVAELCVQRALAWVHKNTVVSGGVLHSPRHMMPYPEVTGYFIPTLLKYGERDLALQYARWLLSIQKPDASWAGFGTDVSYTFDVGQILKGLLSIYRHPDLKKALDPDALERAIVRGCNWMLERIGPDGDVSTPAQDALQLPGGKMVPEAFYLYTMQPLREAGVAFQRPNYLEAVDRVIAYYTNQPGFGDFDTLTHFHAYIVEALLDLDEEKIARGIMQNMESHQRPNGAIPGYAGAPWVCSTGLAQYAVIWARLGETDRARRAFWHVASLQNVSGGFFGGYGPEANYFADAEISWAVKYFLDAHHLLKSVWNKG
jgi:malonyl-CoA O-methyltransferase